jgi:hypothetical protein
MLAPVSDSHEEARGTVRQLGRNTQEIGCNAARVASYGIYDPILHILHVSGSEFRISKLPGIIKGIDDKVLHHFYRIFHLKQNVVYLARLGLCHLIGDGVRVRIKYASEVYRDDRTYRNRNKQHTGHNQGENLAFN